MCPGGSCPARFEHGRALRPFDRLTALSNVEGQAQGRQDRPWHLAEKKMQAVTSKAVGRNILITGGSRSGKSALAVSKAQELAERVCYIATCVPGDEEMKTRVAEHRARRPDSWRTVEEPLHVAKVIGELDAESWPVVVVDCVTLWLFNLMSGENWGREAERRAGQEAEALVGACGRFAGTVILVTNEVGMGIVPGNEISRAFRDAVGRCNQILAAAADEVYLVVAGQPVLLKGDSPA